MSGGRSLGLRRKDLPRRASTDCEDFFVSCGSRAHSGGVARRSERRAQGAGSSGVRRIAAMQVEDCSRYVGQVAADLAAFARHPGDLESYAKKRA